MSVADSILGRRLLQLAAALTALPLLIGGGEIGHSTDPRLKAGPDSTGSLPKSVTPAQTNGPTSPIKTPTVGYILDATTHQPIADALLFVTTPVGEIAGLTFTNDNGVFVVYLFDLPDLELSIPMEGVAGIPIEAGDVLTIFVP